MLKWSLETNLPESRRDFAVIAIDEKILADNKELKHDVGFYVIGGEGVNGRALNSVWFYKVKRKMWIKKPSLNLGRYGLAAVMINDEIWVAGGIINHNSSDGNSESFKTKTAHKITDTMEILNLNRTHDTLAKQHKDEYLYGLYRVDAGGGEGLDVGHGRLVNEPTQYGGDKIGDVNSGNDCCNIGQWYISRLHLRIPRLFGKFCKMPNNELYLLGGIGFKGHDPQHKFTSLSDIDVYNNETA
ncbi:hypothetical protein DOY81_014804 [Sarcophaga bullata]|nr:hypothetical protein DOY81_014804 [Sarcophaga bullata]